MAAGFIGKLVVFQAGWNAGLLPLLIVLVLSSVLAFGYYLRIILVMWVKEPVERFQPVGSTVALSVYAAAAACLVLFVFAAPFLDWATRASAGFIQ